MSIAEKNISLLTDGMGIVMYSSENVKGIPKGYDYLSNEFSEPEQVANHLQKGDMVGFCTGTGGDFILKIKNGSPNAEIMEEYPFSIKLWIEVKDNKICFIDLFWLSEWNDDCPPEQTAEIPNGYYYITILTKKPQSGIWGDEQEIYLYFQPISEMPKMSYNGVPQLGE